MENAKVDIHTHNYSLLQNYFCDPIKLQFGLAAAMFAWRQKSVTFYLGIRVAKQAEDTGPANNSRNETRI